MKSKKNFGLRLRKCREKARLSQLEISKMLGIHNSTYGKYELGVREPDVQMINKLADFFEVTSDYLLCRTDNPQGIINKDSTESDIYNTLIETRTFKGKRLTDEEVEKMIEYFEFILRDK